MTDTLPRPQAVADVRINRDPMTAWRSPSWMPGDSPWLEWVDPSPSSLSRSTLYAFRPGAEPPLSADSSMERIVAVAAAGSKARVLVSGWGVHVQWVDGSAPTRMDEKLPGYKPVNCWPGPRNQVWICARHRRRPMLGRWQHALFVCDLDSSRIELKRVIPSLPAVTGLSWLAGETGWTPVFTARGRTLRLREDGILEDLPSTSGRTCIAVNAQQQMWVADGRDLTLVDPHEGEVIERHSVAAGVTGLCFGGQDLRTLYITIEPHREPEEEHPPRRDLLELPVDVPGLDLKSMDAPVPDIA